MNKDITIIREAHVLAHTHIGGITTTLRCISAVATHLCVSFFAIPVHKYLSEIDKKCYSKLLEYSLTVRFYVPEHTHPWLKGINVPLLDYLSFSNLKYSTDDSFIFHCKNDVAVVVWFWTYNLLKRLQPRQHPCKVLCFVIKQENQENFFLFFFLIPQFPFLSKIIKKLTIQIIEG